MIEALDSAYAPNVAQIAAAKAAGFRGWNGYFAGPNILNGWSDADFHRVLDGGLATLAFCSGWADPNAMRLRGVSLGIPIVLDDEPLIRPFGAWAQIWCDASGAGHYGGQHIVTAIAASRYILANYPIGGDPGGESWPSWLVRPHEPCGWQWAGSHSVFGANVDSEWLEDGFYGVFGPGGGTISRTHGGVADVTTILTPDGAALQFGRGVMRGDGKRGLYMRRLVKGAWASFIEIQPGGDLGVDDLGDERIVPSVDASGALSITVTGSDGRTWYDTISVDGGATWSPFKNSGGAGDGLISVSAGSGSTSPTPTPEPKSVTGTFTGTVS